jgi:hypothetical protein
MKHTSYTCDLCGNKATKVNGLRSTVVPHKGVVKASLVISATINLTLPTNAPTDLPWPEHVCLPCIIKALTGVSDE